ncbi:hypothetical protein HPB51_007457 [Rhipicephalus microplus]|uniref:CCHC-type domain-containing protein n=1 Tax=Rhipicephalus microplus TaxID=6941 RepID=A0A9J6E8D9_RHIMP|nr:hypothetical protein HPB51_007457 [Rhipicephalus microplus]
MASEQNPSRRSFLFDPVATDLISFEADGCNSTEYGPLGNPLLLFTGRDPFFGAPYGDASRLKEDHSPSQASNGLYQLFETHALPSPSPAQSPLGGLSPVDDVVREPARLTDNVAAFTDPRWPETCVGDAFEERGPPCAAVDLFASRVRPQAPVGVQTLPSSMPCTGPLQSDVHVGEQARAPVMAAPALEQSPLHATAAQLLNVLLEAVRSQPCALKGDPESPQPSVPCSLRVPLPEYSGYSDRISATEYLNALHRDQQATRLSDSVMLGSVLPMSLTAEAARWYRLVGHQARSMEEFRALFRSEFLPPEYKCRMRHELELRTQHADESLLEYVRALQELYLLADPTASDAEKVKRAIRQAHPTFAAYLRSARYHDLNELASDAKCIQGDILAARVYRPPPSASLELRCACAGRVLSHWCSPNHEAASAARDQDALDVSDRALDPYSYARAATVARQREQERKPRAPVHEGISVRGAPTAASEQIPRSSKGSPKSPPVGGKGVVCFHCRERGHTKRKCNAPQQTQGPARPLGNGVSRRDGPSGALRPFAAPPVVSAASKSPDATRKKEERRPSVTPAARVSPSDAKTGLWPAQRKTVRVYSFPSSIMPQ